MSIEVTVKQTGIFKKELPLEVILGNQLKYGNFDGLRLSEGELGEDEFIAYHPAHIARGFSVTWKQGEREEVDLRLLTPTCQEELDDFYSCVTRIAGYWKHCVIELEGEPKKLQEFQSTRDDMLKFNLDVLHNIGKDESTLRAPLTLFCAFWPLVLGKEDLEELSKSTDLSAFRDYMHEKQKLDVYYAKPSFYQDEEGIFGAYAITEETRSVFPVEPYVPMGITDPNTGEQLKVDRWCISLFSITENRIVGRIDYSRFLKSVPDEMKTPYDAGNVIIEPIELKMMKEMCE